MVDAAGIQPARPIGPNLMPAGADEFRLIADSAPVGVWVTGPDGRHSFVNRTYIQFLGLEAEAARNFNWRELLHPDDAARVIAESIAGEASLETFSLIGRYRRHDGAWRWLESTSQPRWDAAGRHIGFVGVAHDVTDAREAEAALREREAQFSAFINQATAGFGQVDLEGRFTLVNDRFCEIAGWSREELMERTMQSITHPDDLARNMPLFERAVREGTPYTHEKRYVRKDGGIVWVSNSVAVIRRGDGEPFGVLAVTLDITPRRAAEEALHRSAESLRLAVEGAGMAAWELDLDTMEGEWSPNRFDLLGVARRPDHRGTVEDWLARVHPEDEPMARAAAFGCFRDGKPYSIEYRIRRADTGEERWLQSHGSRIDHGTGAARFVGISFDVTERKRGEQELRESEERFRTIFEQANDFLVTWDLEQRITSINPAVLTALGYRKDEMIGRSIRDFLDEEQFELARETLRESLAQGQAARLTVDVRDRDGHAQTWEISAQLTEDAEGRRNGIHAIGRDMSEAKRFEAHQQLLIDELNHRVKNTLAIVQSIAQQSFKDGIDLKMARGAFEGRLAALSEAHNLLTREQWSPVPMTRIITNAVASHGGSGRFTCDGPELMIAPKTAISLALAMHELATNALKHGALSVPGGSVTIRWRVPDTAEGRRLQLDWREQGGPPVTKPTRRGFGTRMIERGLAAELGGKVVIDFAPDGLHCTVDAPLPGSVA